jgi:16S rRNA (guanine(527)-N(7))-methyltransferase RsmG
MLFNFKPFFEYAQKNNISLPEHTEKALTTYGELLLKWNEQINLTAITDPEEIVIKHFIDSMSILKYIDLKDGQSLIDVGTGAGFPGMVIKILRPNVNVTLLDGHGKRFIFLKDLEETLGIFAKNLHNRAELAAKDETLRESFDFAVARAVARFPTLLEYCMPFVKVGGYFVSMKGPEAKEEILEGKNAVSILGGSEPTLFEELLPNDNKRSFIITKKAQKTPPKYPRPSAKIKSKSL